MPFLYDMDAHVRFLIALPLLVVAELVVHQRMRPVIRQFVERGLIADAARAKFDAALASALRLRNSVAAEVGLIAFVYGRRDAYLADAHRCGRGELVRRNGAGSSADQGPDGHDGGKAGVPAKMLPRVVDIR